MPQQTPERNPFMLMINPEVVFAAMEASERLGQLNRHLCRPLDRVVPVGAEAASTADADDGDEEDDAAAEAAVFPNESVQS